MTVKAIEDVRVGDAFTYGELVRVVWGWGTDRQLGTTDGFERELAAGSYGSGCGIEQRPHPILGRPHVVVNVAEFKAWVLGLRRAFVAQAVQGAGG